MSIQNLLESAICIFKYSSRSGGFYYLHGLNQFLLKCYLQNQYEVAQHGLKYNSALEHTAYLRKTGMDYNHNWQDQALLCAAFLGVCEFVVTKKIYPETCTFCLIQKPKDQKWFIRQQQSPTGILWSMHPTNFQAPNEILHEMVKIFNFTLQ